MLRGEQSQWGAAREGQNDLKRPLTLTLTLMLHGKRHPRTHCQQSAHPLRQLWQVLPPSSCWNRNCSGPCADKHCSWDHTDVAWTWLLQKGNIIPGDELENLGQSLPQLLAHCFSPMKPHPVQTFLPCT